MGLETITRYLLAQSKPTLADATDANVLFWPRPERAFSSLCMNAGSNPGLLRIASLQNRIRLLNPIPDIRAITENRFSADSYTCTATNDVHALQ
jgi:hypothetical protein